MRYRWKKARMSSGRARVLLAKLSLQSGKFHNLSPQSLSRSLARRPARFIRNRDVGVAGGPIRSAPPPRRRCRQVIGSRDSCGSRRRSSAFSPTASATLFQLAQENRSLFDNNNNRIPLRRELDVLRSASVGAPSGWYHDLWQTIRARHKNRGEGLIERTVNGKDSNDQSSVRE